MRIVLSPGAAATVEERRGEGGRRSEGVWPDAADLGLCEAIARTLAPLRLEDRERGPASADEVRALDLFGLRSAAEVDPRATWRPRPRREQLRVPIGVGGAGEPVTLDLKQAAEGGLGPHGLIVGATGSGKSELLRTLISGLALRHPPDTLSFVLIDYKGGAAFAELARLPHAAGLITNLQRDGSLVDRMRDALLGEQERRQAMLRDAGNIDDIRAYRQAREQRPDRSRRCRTCWWWWTSSASCSRAGPEFIDLFLGHRPRGPQPRHAPAVLEPAARGGASCAASRATCATGSACGPTRRSRARSCSARPTPTCCRRSRAPPT